MDGVWKMLGGNDYPTLFVDNFERFFCLHFLYFHYTTLVFLAECCMADVAQLVEP